MMAVEGTTEIDVPNSSLQADCELVKGAVELPKNDPLKGSVTLRSKLRHSQTYQCRWRWFDSEGTLLATSEVTWHTLSIAPKEERTVGGQAPNNLARKAKFQLRYYDAPDSEPKK